MKKMCIILLLVIIGFVSCNEDGSPILSFLNTSNLPPQFYEININADTVLHTKNGADITIRKGSIKADNKTTVTLEVKEAYSMEDIVKAGLQTISDGKPLSSGGMIYLNVKDKEAKIISPIRISMPSNNVEKNMQLFKGDTDKKGNINWTAPKPLLPNKTFDTIAEGKAIFMSNCSSCHNILKDATGPHLAFINQRLDKEWMKKWIRNSSEMIANGDPYANCVYERYGKTAMTAFPNLTDDELEELYRYIDDETKHLNLKDYTNFKASWDSCVAFEKLKDEFRHDRFELAKEDEVVVVINPNLSENNFSQANTKPFVWPQNKVIPKNAQSTYYQFDIETFGWYNVDAFMNDVKGFAQSKLTVMLKGKFTKHTNIYLIIPELKSFTIGGLLEGKEDSYGFYTDDGILNLPQGKEAYIMAFTESGDNITFAMNRFTTGLENNLVVTPQIISKEAMNQKIKELHFLDLAIEAKDSKNADSIRTIDVKLKDIESLKPKGIDCNCGYQSNDTASLNDFEQ